VSDAKRSAIVSEARTWLGTPYHHAADIVGVGVDCAMILVRVFCDLGLIEPFDPRPYTKDWMLHREDERYLGFLIDRSCQVERPAAGDVILFRVGRCFSHGGIVSGAEPLKIIHAFAPARCVVEEEIARNPELAGRLSQAMFFSVVGA
jgi:NlpC/P60 family putative phage cell wall peptidase